MRDKSYIVGIYVRLSNDDERTGESASIENQKMLLSKYVKEQGWELKGTYCDDGFSGTNQNRPGFQRMLRDVENGVINTIVIKDLSRLGRNHLEVGNFVEVYLASHGCELISLSETIDEMMVFRNWFNENHSRETSKKVKAIKKMFAENGKFLGTYAPYGFKRNPDNKHQLIIDEQTSPIVQRIFEYRSQGKGFRAIACILNDEKITPPRDYYYESNNAGSPKITNHLWSDSSIQLIIRNEAYIGNMVQMKKGTKTYKTRKLTRKPESEWIRAEGTHEPIICLELWQKVKDIDERKYRPRKRSDGTTSIFTGLLKCADCGYSMRSHTEKGKRKDGSDYLYSSFICNNYGRSGKNACTPHTIYENALTQLVIATIQSDATFVKCNENHIIESITQMKDKERYSYRTSYEKELKVHQTRIKKLEGLIPQLYEDRYQGIIDDTFFKEYMPKYQQEKEDRIKAVREIEEKLLAVRQDHDDATRWVSVIKPYCNIQKLSADTLLTLIDRIEVGEAERIAGSRVCSIRIVYKYVGDIEWLKALGMTALEDGEVFTNAI